MSKDILVAQNYLFFLQLLLPICDLSKSGVKKDPRMLYYSKVEKFLCKDTYDIGLGGSYGHPFENVTVRGIIIHDDCIVRDGIRGSIGEIYRRWMDGGDCDDHISKCNEPSEMAKNEAREKICNNDAVPK